MRALSRTTLVATVTAATALHLSAPAAAIDDLLPPEDRAAIAAGTEDAQRLYDLLPEADVPSGDADGEAEPAEGADGSSLDEAAPETAPEATPEPVVHVLARGESLADVATLHGIDGIDGWRRLFDANPHIEDPDLVTTGTHVRIPAPGEEVAPRELPAPPPPPRREGGERTSRAGGGGGGGGAGVWDQLAACESGGNWAANTGNGYYGGLQFSASSWAAVGGTGLPHEHSRGTQIAMGERLRAAQGWGAWPSCARRLGLR
jgi:hypothetical protein